MNTSFSIILENNQNVDKMVKKSKEHFDIMFLTRNSNYATLIDDNKTYIIKIGMNWLKFIVSGDKEANINDKFKLIEEFISNNFAYQTIGIEYLCNDYNIGLNELTNVKIINLQ